MTEMITLSQLTSYSLASDEIYAGLQSDAIGGGNVYVGGNGTDVVANYANGTVILTGDGNDYISSVGSGVTIDAGQDDNSVISIGSNNFIKTGEGDDQIYSQGNYNTIRMGDGDDKVYLSGNHIDLGNIGFGSKTIKSAAFTFEYIKNQSLAIKNIAILEDFYNEEEES